MHLEMSAAYPGPCAFPKTSNKRLRWLARPGPFSDSVQTPRCNTTASDLHQVRRLIRSFGETFIFRLASKPPNAMFRVQDARLNFHRKLIIAFACLVIALIALSLFIFINQQSPSMAVSTGRLQRGNRSLRAPTNASHTRPRTTSCAGMRRSCGLTPNHGHAVRAMASSRTPGTINLRIRARRG